MKEKYFNRTTNLAASRDESAHANTFKQEWRNTTRRAAGFDSPVSCYSHQAYNLIQLRQSNHSNFLDKDDTDTINSPKQTFNALSDMASSAEYELASNNMLTVTQCSNSEGADVPRTSLTLEYNKRIDATRQDMAVPWSRKAKVTFCTEYDNCTRISQSNNEAERNIDDFEFESELNFEPLVHNEPLLDRIWSSNNRKPSKKVDDRLQILLSAATSQTAGNDAQNKSQHEFEYLPFESADKQDQSIFQNEEVLDRVFGFHNTVIHAGSTESYVHRIEESQQVNEITASTTDSKTESEIPEDVKKTFKLAFDQDGSTMLNSKDDTNTTHEYEHIFQIEATDLTCTSLLDNEVSYEKVLNKIIANEPIETLHSGTTSIHNLNESHECNAGLADSENSRIRFDFKEQVGSNSLNSENALNSEDLVEYEHIRISPSNTKEDQNQVTLLHSEDALEKIINRQTHSSQSHVDVSSIQNEISEENNNQEKSPVLQNIDLVALDGNKVKSSLSRQSDEACRRSIPGLEHSPNSTNFLSTFINSRPKQRQVSIPSNDSSESPYELDHTRTSQQHQKEDIRNTTELKSDSSRLFNNISLAADTQPPITNSRNSTDSSYTCLYEDPTCSRRVMQAISGTLNVECKNTESTRQKDQSQTMASQVCTLKTYKSTQDDSIEEIGLKHSDASSGLDIIIGDVVSSVRNPGENDVSNATCKNFNSQNSADALCDDDDGPKIKETDEKDFDALSEPSTLYEADRMQNTFYLAVKRSYIPENSVVAIVGNVVELGDWNLDCAEKMLEVPAPSAKLSETHCFYRLVVSFHESSPREVEFRYIIMLSTEVNDSEERELKYWEGGWPRKLDSYTDNSLMVFGHYDTVKETIRLDDAYKVLDFTGNIPLLPGWLSKPHQIKNCVSVHTSSIEWEDNDISVKDSPFWVASFISLVKLKPENCAETSLEARLCENVAFGGNITGIGNQQSDFVPVTNTKDCWLSFSYTSSSKTKAPIASEYFYIMMYFTNTNTTAIAFVPSATTCQTQVQEFTTERVELLTRDTKSQGLKTLARMNVEILRIFPTCNTERLNFVDDCGPTNVPFAPKPINIVIPNNLHCESLYRHNLIENSIISSIKTFVCLNITNSEVGIRIENMCTDVTRSNVNKGKSISQSNFGELSNLEVLFKRLPLTTGIVLNLRNFDCAAKQQARSLNQYADSLLVLLLNNVANRWVLLISEDPNLCIVLSSKQMRFPVGYVHNSDMQEKRITSFPMALTFCNVNNLMALVVSERELQNNPLQLKKAHQLGLLLFLNCEQENIQQMKPASTYYNGERVDGVITDSNAMKFVQIS